MVQRRSSPDFAPPGKRRKFNGFGLLPMTNSPTARLLVGLLITLAAVTVFSWYSLFQLSGLKELQTKTIDGNREDSLQLLRVQNDLNTLGLHLRDMTDAQSTTEIGGYQKEFSRLRADLEDAISKEAKLAPVTRRPDKQQGLLRLMKQFWQTSDQVFLWASSGKEAEARQLASTKLRAEQSHLAGTLSRLLERNNEAEERADVQVASIYLGVERNIYWFLAAVLLAIVATSLYLIYSNRRIFEAMESLSRQRRVLAGKLIAVQEEVLRSVSRELHDEFGQILTAVGAMLARAERKGVPPDSPLRTELSEVREITHNTLEKMRSLSQMLHPAVLDDYGLAKAMEWYSQLFQRQTGIATSVAVTPALPPRITGQPAIHCFRIVQEALNNAAKHSGTKHAEVELVFEANTLTIHVRDFGRGMVTRKKSGMPGLGQIAMQERAALVQGTLSVSSVLGRGTTVSLTMPYRQDDQPAEPMAVDREERQFAVNDR
ncbi:MAG TPA: ATP-binding protein [Bryobacteraceae bacterium]|jgi:signal transduction histidine kinase|nr:ATP-binding protein [Bryobacteraceae bacterium]